MYVCSEPFVEYEFVDWLTVRLNKMSKFFLDLIGSETSILGIGTDGKGDCAIKFEAYCQNL